MRIVLAARGVALVIVVVMIVYFLTTDAVRSGNPFLVPDAVLTVLLLVSALLPRRTAVPAMIFAFGWAAAVYTVSLWTYIVRGAFADGAEHIGLIAACVVMAVLLGHATYAATVPANAAGSSSQGKWAAAR